MVCWELQRDRDAQGTFLAFDSFEYHLKHPPALPPCSPKQLLLLVSHALFTAGVEAFSVGNRLMLFS